MGEFKLETTFVLYVFIFFSVNIIKPCRLSFGFGLQVGNIIQYNYADIAFCLSRAKYCEAVQCMNVMPSANEVKCWQ
jgi:hypothetical protein